MQTMLFNSQPKQTLFSALLDAIATFGRKRRLIEDMSGTEYSYGQLLKTTLVLGRLIGSFTRAGENVGVLMPNLASTLCLIIGMNAWRRVPAMLNYTAGVDGMQNACTAANIKTIVSSRKFLQTAKLETQIAELKNIKLIYLEDLRAQFTFTDKLWLMGFALWLPRLAVSGQHPDEPAVVLFASGSEGKPKGVVLSHRALLSNIAQIRAVIDFSVEDKILNALPIFHSFGLTAGALLPLLTGTKLFLYPSPLHYRVIPELAYDRNCTILFGTSTFLGNYAKFAHPYDFYKLRYVLAGAEKLSQSVRDVWSEKFGLRILEGYGATETAPALAVNTPMAYRSGTVGQLLPGIEARLIPATGIARGGILHVCGPNVMSGYYRHENPGVIDPPCSEVGPGWYNTGDVVDIDAEGFVHILGRIKRFARVAGEMVSLEVVEIIANQTSSNHQHGAATQADAQRGENIVLFTTDPELNREKLQTTARNAGYPDLAVPRKIACVETLPLLGTGKVDYLTLQKLAQTV